MVLENWFMEYLLQAAWMAIFPHVSYLKQKSNVLPVGLSSSQAGKCEVGVKCGKEQPGKSGVSSKDKFSKGSDQQGALTPGRFS